MKILILPLIILLFIPTTTLTTHTQKCPKGTTARYVYVYLVIKECMHEISSNTNTTTLNNNNIQYNQGVAAGQNATGQDWKYPTSHTKAFCDGWNQTACNSEGCGGDYTCVNPNQPKGVKGCPNDKK
ncbi:MAG: hypothetical protein WAM14_02555 [Candidatus Nitrosopolaris sp.]